MRYSTPLHGIVTCRPRSSPPWGNHSFAYWELGSLLCLGSKLFSYPAGAPEPPVHSPQPHDVDAEFDCRQDRHNSIGQDLSTHTFPQCLHLPNEHSLAHGTTQPQACTFLIYIYVQGSNVCRVREHTMLQVGCRTASWLRQADAMRSSSLGNERAAGPRPLGTREQTSFCWQWGERVKSLG